MPASRRGMMLTEAGVAYVAAAKRILEEVSHAERAASGEYNTPRGDLVIMAPIAFKQASRADKLQWCATGLEGFITRDRR